MVKISNYMYVYVPLGPDAQCCVDGNNPLLSQSDKTSFLHHVHSYAHAGSSTLEEHKKLCTHLYSRIYCICDISRIETCVVSHTHEANRYVHVCMCVHTKCSYTMFISVQRNQESVFKAYL